MASDRAVPYSAFNFLVEFFPSDPSFPGPVGGFSDVSGINTEFVMAEYRAGNDKQHYVHKIPGMQKTGDVTLKRGIINSKALFDWIRKTRTLGPGTKRGVKISLFDEANSLVGAWFLSAATPMKYSGPTLNGKGGNEVAMEELVLSCESLDYDDTPSPS